MLRTVTHRIGAAAPRLRLLVGLAFGSTLCWAVAGSAWAEPQASAGSAAGATKGPLPAERLRAELPADAVEIDAARRAAIGAPIVLRGRVPVGADVFATGQAIFTLVDEEAARTCCPPSPTEAQSNAPCPAPPERRATISVLDGQGRPLAVDLRGRHGLTPGAEVFVVGAVATPAAPGGLAVTAEAIHVPEASLPVGTLLPAEPAGALDVAEVRKRAGKGETVVLVGRVGGSVRPFVPGRAIFTLVGRGLKACSDIPGDECTKPWDYCCETKEAILANSATIQLVAPGGGKAGPLRTEIKGRTGPGGGRSIRELSELVVVGTVSVAEKGALVVNATQVFVR